MTDSTPIEYVAAIATALSAIVIAWQAVLTRRSVKASEESVEASQEALGIAEATLREAQLARVEAASPRVMVNTRGFSASTIYQTGDDRSMSSVQYETIYKMPRDGDIRLTDYLPVTLTNDGPGTAILMAGGQLYDKDHNIVARDVTLRSGETKAVLIRITKSVAEWSRRGEDAAEAAKPILYTFRYQGARDSDIDEVHTIALTGSLLSPVENQNGDYQNEVFASLESKTLPSVRTYWRSRSANLQF